MLVLTPISVRNNLKIDSDTISLCNKIALGSSLIKISFQNVGLLNLPGLGWVLHDLELHLYPHHLAVVLLGPAPDRAVYL